MEHTSPNSENFPAKKPGTGTGTRTGPGLRIWDTP